MSVPYTCLLFDADGTLFDYETASASALEAALAEHGAACDSAVLAAYRRINQALWREFELGQVSADALAVLRFERLAGEFGLSLQSEPLSTTYLRCLSERPDLLEGAREAIETLRHQYRLALVTNGLTRVQRGRFSRSPLAACMEAIVISDEVGCAKPDPRIFKITLDRLKNPPKAEVLMIGDNWSSDIVGACEFGLDACWFNPTGAPRPDNRLLTYEVRTFGELVELLA